MAYVRAPSGGMLVRNSALGKALAAKLGTIRSS